VRIESVLPSRHQQLHGQRQRLHVQLQARLERRALPDRYGLSLMSSMRKNKETKKQRNKETKKQTNVLLGVLGCWVLLRAQTSTNARRALVL
jgi:hypothetical protein